jgi:hypothetical protein
MIGYVMDGEVTKAIAAVSNAIENKSDKLNLLAGTGMTQTSFVKWRRLLRQVYKQ